MNLLLSVLGNSAECLPRRWHGTLKFKGIESQGMAPAGVCLPFDLIIGEPPLLALREMQISAELP